MCYCSTAASLVHSVAPQDYTARVHYPLSWWWHSSGTSGSLCLSLQYSVTLLRHYQERAFQADSIVYIGADILRQ